MILSEAELAKLDKAGCEVRTPAGAIVEYRTPTEWQEISAGFENLAARLTRLTIEVREVAQPQTARSIISLEQA